MANAGRTPGLDDDEPIESRRAGLAKTDPDAPLMPDGEPAPSPELSEMGEFAPEAARSSPLDEIAEAERERMPRD